MKSYKFFTTDATECNKQVKNLITNSKTFKTRLAQVCASVIATSVAHGQVQQVRDLYDGLLNQKETPIRTNELRDWLLEKGPYEWASIDVKSTDKDGNEVIKQEDHFILNKAKRNEMFKEFNDDALKAEEFFTNLIVKPYWVDKPVKVTQPFDLSTELFKLIAKAEKRMEKPKTDNDNFEGIDEIKKAFEAIAKVHVA